jgi:hypothetical protein
MPTDTAAKRVVCGHAVNDFIALVLTIQVMITAIDYCHNEFMHYFP